MSSEVSVTENVTTVTVTDSTTTVDINPQVTEVGLGVGGLHVTGTVTSEGLVVDTNTLYVDATNNKVGIGTTSPGSALTVKSSTFSQLRLEDDDDRLEIGYATATAYFKTGDNNTKINFRKTDNTDVMTVDMGNERVGIGTDSPSRTLHLKDAIAGIRLEDSDNNSYGELIYNTGSNGLLIRSDHGNNDEGSNIIFQVDGSEKMKIGSTGNVGIGTSSPDSSIQVKSSGTNNQSLLKLNTDSGTRAFIGSDAQDDGYLYLYDGSDNLKTAFRTDGNDSYIAGGGNVGIGTSSPNRILDIESSIPAVRFTDTTVSGLYHEIISGDGNNLQIKADDGGVGSSSAISFDVDGSEKMRIKHTGNVGIGTSSPKQQLHISGGTTSGDVTKVTIGATGANAETHLQLAENFSGNNMHYGFSFVADGNDTNNLLIKNHDDSTTGAVALSVARTNGNVGIGTSSPTEILDIDGDSIRLRQSQTPASATATGTQGQIAWDANYMYVCTATNTWKRVALATW